MPASTYTRQEQFFRKAITVLTQAEVPFMIGGSYAYMHHTRTTRPTKDIDIFCTPSDTQRALKAFRKAGMKTELTYAHWLGKVYDSHNFADVVFSSSNGKNVVTREWLARSSRGWMLDLEVHVIAPEDVLLTKIYIMGRDCFHGHDIYKLIRILKGKLDWRLVWKRARPDWQVFMAHVLIFDYVFPKDRDKIPNWLRQELKKKLEVSQKGSTSRKFKGNMLSLVDYATPEQLKMIHNHPKRK